MTEDRRRRTEGKDGTWALKPSNLRTLSVNKTLDKGIKQHILK